MIGDVVVAREWWMLKVVEGERPWRRSGVAGRKKEQRTGSRKASEAPEADGASAEGTIQTHWPRCSFSCQGHHRPSRFGQEPSEPGRGQSCSALSSLSLSKGKNDRPLSFDQTIGQPTVKTKIEIQIKTARMNERTKERTCRYLLQPASTALQCWYLRVSPLRILELSRPIRLYQVLENSYQTRQAALQSEQQTRPGCPEKVPAPPPNRPQNQSPPVRPMNRRRDSNQVVLCTLYLTRHYGAWSMTQWTHLLFGTVDTKDPDDSTGLYSRQTLDSLASLTPSESGSLFMSPPGVRANGRPTPSQRSSNVVVQKCNAWQKGTIQKMRGKFANELAGINCRPMACPVYVPPTRNWTALSEFPPHGA
jgi:hypothetical protein